MFSLLDIAELPVDYSRLKVRVPLSGGINSAAVLCMLGEYHPDHLKPKELHLYYAHFKEHSPDTFKFTAACIRYARRKFSDVRVRVTRNSVNKYFIEQKMIPHPMISPCSVHLKIEPMQGYDRWHGIDVVLIGYVRHEMARYHRAQARAGENGRTKDVYPLLNWTDDNCLSIVRDVIGWYPAIYDLVWTRDHLEIGLCREHEVGQRVFSHNNCLPCKNMTKRQLLAVGLFYPKRALAAQETAARIPNAYWGRDDVPDAFKCDVCDRM